MSATNVGLRLRESRLRRGFSVEKAAGLAGVSTSTIKRWEAGRGIPRMEGLRTYAGELGLTASDLNSSPCGSSVQRLLRAKRRRSQATLAQLSDATGLSVSCLHRFETGSRGCDASMAKALGLAYGCNAQEIEVAFGADSPVTGDVISQFLAPGLLPHANLYAVLDRITCQSDLAPSETVVDVLHGFMIMGDHAGMLESWELLRSATSICCLTPAQKVTVNLSLAMATASVRRDLGPARRLLARFNREEACVPMSAMSHLSRLAALDRDHDAAWNWNLRLEKESQVAGEAGLAFVSQLNRLVLEFGRDPSWDQVRSLDALRNKCVGSLQLYTLLVAELSMLARLKQFGAARSTMGQCRELEATYGFGSPLAVRVSRHLAATGQ